jgi:2-polyprenyl-3-methyl-5-hydroxy-6-metoxy-1,4-benzoquinol methylase
MIEKSSDNRIYSKPAADVSLEMKAFVNSNELHLARQAAARSELLRAPLRENCNLCKAVAMGQSVSFNLRGIGYIECQVCGHIFSANLPPPNFPLGLGEYSFSGVYQFQDQAAFDSRIGRVYRPKLGWILDSLRASGIDDTSVSQLSWLELGCGAGFFMGALEERGLKHFVGVDQDIGMVEAAQRRFGVDRVLLSRQPLTAWLGERSADILCAFFVFEHVEDLAALSAALRAIPRGVYLVFSVPMFGLSVLFDAISELHFARNLDSGFHTQLFTERSLARFLADSGFVARSEWIFGQDAADLYRCLRFGLRDTFAPDFLDRALGGLLENLDGVQAAIDRSHLSDSRHVLAVRT